MLLSGKHAKNARSISLPSLRQNYLVAMATSLDKLENKVQLHHPHVKCFRMVKRLRKSVQYIRRYSTIYASFWPCRTRRTQIRHVISEVTRQKFTKFLDDVAQSSALLMRTAWPWYCNSFSSTSATNTSGMSWRWQHFRNIIWLPWLHLLKNWKLRYRSIICM